MARFVTDFVVERPDADQFISFISQDFFQKEGFRYVNFEGENVWKKGTGALAAPQFIKLEFQNGHVHLEAWLRTVWLPKVYGKEMDFSGAWGFAVKEMFRKTVYQLIGLLQQPQMVGSASQPAQAPPTQAPPTQAPPMQAPPTQAQPTQAPPMQAQPMQAQPMQAPPTQTPPVQPQQVQAQPTQAPPTQAPPMQAPPTQAQPTQAPPIQAPPTQAPPMQAPPIQAQPGASIPVIVHNTAGSAVLALVMGLVAFVGIFVPLAGSYMRNHRYFEREKRYAVSICRYGDGWLCTWDYFPDPICYFLDWRYHSSDGISVSMFIRQISLLREDELKNSYLWSIPAIQNMEELLFAHPVTFFVWGKRLRKIDTS